MLIMLFSFCMQKISVWLGLKAVQSIDPDYRKTIVKITWLDVAVYTVKQLVLFLKKGVKKCLRQ